MLGLELGKSVSGVKCLEKIAGLNNQYGNIKGV